MRVKETMKSIICDYCGNIYPIGTQLINMKNPQQNQDGSFSVMSYDFCLTGCAQNFMDGNYTASITVIPTEPISINTAISAITSIGPSLSFQSNTLTSGVS